MTRTSTTALERDQGHETLALAARLVTFIGSQVGDTSDVEVIELRRLPSGFSRENWHFRARWGARRRRVERELILRRDPRAGVVDTDRMVEFAVLQALSSSTVPTPEVLWIDRTGEHLGRPGLIMRHCVGAADRHLLTGESQLSEEARIELARTGLQHLAELHRVNWQVLGLNATLPDPGQAAARVAVSVWEEQLHAQMLEPQPELVAVCEWLKERAPTSATTTLVHGDWKPGNWLVDGDRFVVALDWELVHLGDPLEDLGWVTNPARRSQHQIPGRWEGPQIVAAYEELTGAPVSDDDLAYWNVLATFKIAVVELTGVRAFCLGCSERPWRADTRLHRWLLEAISA